MLNRAHSQAAPWLLSLLVATSSCLLTTPRNHGYEKVRIMTEGKASDCESLGIVVGSEVEMFAGVATQAAHDRAKSETVGAGGNAMRIISVNSVQPKNVYKVTVTAEALRCPG